MNIETTAANLNAGLKLMAGVIERRNTIPVLGTVKIGGGKLVGTNLDMVSEVAIPEVGTGDGVAAVDYRSLAALARHTPGDEAVKIAEGDGLAVVSFNGSEYRIASYPATDFPEFKKFEGKRTLTGNAGLVDAIRRIKFAISTEDTRYYLNGVAILAMPDGTPAVAATDGRRLAYVPLSFEIDGAKGKIIPRDTLRYLCGLKGEPNAATFDEATPYAKFEYDGVTVSTKLIDGTFPDIWRVIPKDTVDYFTVDRTVLLPALRRIQAVAFGMDKCVKLAGSQNGLTITADNYETKCRETVAFDFKAKEPFEIGYNIRYLIEFLTAFRGDHINFSADAGDIAGSPCLLTCRDDALRGILMPMRV